MTIAKYLIRRTAKGAPVHLTTHPETAKRYGWATHFEEYIEGMSRDESSGLMVMKTPRLSNARKLGGLQIQISRHPNRSGAMAGQTNKFRVAGQLRFRDLCEIAKFTDVEWHWMTSFNGKRWSREEWLSFHDAYAAGREGAVVPREARLRAKPRTTDLFRLEQGRYRATRGLERGVAFPE